MEKHTDVLDNSCVASVGEDNCFRDKINSMEEGHCVIEVPCMSRNDSEKLNRSAVFLVQNKLLNNRPLYLQLSKDEFSALLLKALGPAKISATIVDYFFSEIDSDSDGWLSVDEITRYLVSFLQHKISDRCRFVMTRLLNPSIWGSFLFLLASLMSISKNLVIRVCGEKMFTDIAALLVKWFSLVGSFMFVWGTYRTTRQQMQDMNSKSIASRIFSLFSKNIKSLNQFINFLWVLGSIAYVTECWLAGGLFYFIGGLLAFPSIYNDKLEELIQNEKLMEKLCASFPELDESRLGFKTLGVPGDFDILSTNSAITAAVTNKTEDHSCTRHLRPRRRSSSESNVNDVCVELKNRHRKTPTYPTISFMTKLHSGLDCDDMSLRSSDTISLINSDCSKNETSSFMSLIGKEIFMLRKYQKQIDCYDAFISFGGNRATLDASTRVLRRVSENSMIDLNSINSLAANTTRKNLKISVFCNLIKLPSLYIALAYAIAGIFFTVGACSSLRFSKQIVQNLYLSGSSFYFCGSAMILCQAWISVNHEWNHLQSIRVALCQMAFDTEREPIYNHDRLKERDF